MVSIVIPSYERADLLERLLSSVKKQTYTRYEVIVIDDNSSDKKAYTRVIEKFSKSMELYYHCNDVNRGAQFSRNKGINSSKYKYIAFVDDDDEWFPDKLEKQVNLFESSSQQLGLVYSWADSIDESGSIVFRYRNNNKGNDASTLLASCFIPSPTVMVRSEAVRKAGGFDENLSSCQDWDMWLRIVKCGYSYDLVQEVLALNYKHERASIGKSPKSLQGFYEFYKKHGDSYIELGMRKSLSERYRGLACSFMVRKNDNYALDSIIRSIKIYKYNFKSWLVLLKLIVNVKL